MSGGSQFIACRCIITNNYLKDKASVRGKQPLEGGETADDAVGDDNEDRIKLNTLPEHALHASNSCGRRQSTVRIVFPTTLSTNGSCRSSPRDPAEKKTGLHSRTTGLTSA